ncbi:unnamed protein product [Prunus armeniaca]
MGERDSDEGSKKVVGIGVQTWRWFHCKMSRFCLIEFVNNSVQVPKSHNIYWKELSMLVYVSVAFLIVHIVKGRTIALNFVTE